MSKRRKILITIAIILIFVSSYPAFVLGYTWICVYQTDFQGGKHGPLDAYRHTLASSIVAYTLNETAVDLVTDVMENGDKASNKMDAHNNKIGAKIGAKSQSFSELKSTVFQSVLNGSENTVNPNQITWLSKDQWGEGRLF